MDGGGGFGAADVGGVDDESLMASVVALQRQRAELEFAEAVALAELEERGAVDVVAGLRTPGWLAREGKLPASVARTRVRVAAMLRRWLPEVAVALGSGRISWEHARVLVRVANP